MRIRLVVNPVAGGGKGAEQAAALVAALERRGIISELRLTRRPGDGRAFAAEPGVDGVVAIGGDGTANEVANGLAQQDGWLAVMPLGTANVVARELGMPREPDAMAALLAEGHTRRIDVGIHNGKRFLLGAGAGYDAAVVQYVHERRRGRLSIARYFWPALRLAFTYAYPPIRVTVDGMTLCDDAHYVIAGNCRYSAGIFPLTPEARMDNGQLDVCILRNLNLFGLIRLALIAYRPNLPERKGVLYTKGTDVRFEPSGAGPVPLQVDGDPRGMLPARFTILPGALPVIAPGAPCQ